MSRLNPVEYERAKGMLQANVTPLVIAQQFLCNSRTIERLRNRLPQTGTTSDYAHSRRNREMTRCQDRDELRSQRLNHFRWVRVTVRTYPVTRNPRISPQTVTNLLLEIGK